MLRFPGNRRPISCTAGALAACLAERADTGVSTLKAALGLWLIPRHAEQIQNAVEQGSIVLWVRLLESDDEPLASASTISSLEFAVRCDHPIHARIGLIQTVTKSLATDEQQRQGHGR